MCEHLEGVESTRVGFQDRNPWSAGGTIPAVNRAAWGGARVVFKWNIIKEEGEGKLACSHEKCGVSNPDLLQLSRY